MADNLLKNDGKFIEMMEHLAERRMARTSTGTKLSAAHGANGVARDANVHHQHVHNHTRPFDYGDEEDDDDDDEDRDEYEEEDDYEDRDEYEEEDEEDEEEDEEHVRNLCLRGRGLGVPVGSGQGVCKQVFKLSWPSTE